MMSKLLIITAVSILTFIPSSYTQNSFDIYGASKQKFLISDIQKQIDVLHYDLNLELNPKEKILNGIATIKACKISNSSVLPNIEFNFYDNLQVVTATLNGNNIDYTRKNNKIYFNSGNDITDTFVVVITYSGTPQRGGFDGFVFGSVQGNSLIYNISEPNFASTWFPCDDDPADKAYLDMKITNDSQYVSVSNGLLESIVSTCSKKTYHYKTLYPISTYLVAVYSAPYKSYYDIYSGLSGNDSMKIEYYVMPEHFDYAKTDFADHVDMMGTLSKLFGEYPFIKEKYGVAEFLWNFGAMENQTITGIGYNFIGGHNFFLDTYVHELAHHWWGNSVGPKTWNDIWLNEGFATYSEALYAEAKGGKEALKYKMQSKFSDNFRGTLYAPKDLFGQTVYDKGAWVLHMLRYEIGDSNFFNSLHKYYDLYKYSNASVEDFKEVCENVSGLNLDKYFDQWVYKGANNIFCSYTFACDEIENQEECAVNIFQEPQDYNEFHFPLEIEFLFDDNSSVVKKVNIDRIESKFIFYFDKKIETIRLDPDSKLLGTFEKSYSR